MPLVSIIVAVYNLEKYIEACIQSLLKQTYENIEILLIDDGSKDDSLSICNEYAKKDQRIRVIDKENGGIADVRNLGIKEALGKYMMFVDGDDTVSPQYVELPLKCAEKNDTDIVLFDIMEIEEETGHTGIWETSLTPNIVLNAECEPEVLLAAPSPCNKLYRTEFVRNTGITYPLNRNYEDLTVIPCLMAATERVVYLKCEPLYYYMIHKGSIMRSERFQKNFNDRTAATDSIIEYFKENGLYIKYEKELEYLVFEHAYFVPTKEILMYSSKSEYLDKYRQYALSKFPNMLDNQYVYKLLSKKDKLILQLMNRKLYAGIQLLSKLRKQVDLVRNKR